MRTFSKEREDERYNLENICKRRFIESMLDVHVSKVMVLSIEDISFYLFYNNIIKC